MKRFFGKFKFAYYYIVNSIGFYPTVISLIFALLAMVMLYLETLGLSKSLKDNLPLVIISNGDTARLILSSITTGIISLTVFSFTMVMLVLNQASSNFSPRVIPGLISYKSNQRVMGLYLGTLIYTLIIMVNVHSDYYTVPLPGFSIFLAMCFTILCLGFFVYFIHSISLSIQIESILESIYEVTKRELETEIKEDDKGKAYPILEANNWITLNSPRTGYLQSINEEAVVEMCKEYELVLCFMQPLGNFLIDGIPFAKINKKLENLEEFTSGLFAHLNFYREERPDINYLFGFKHITESAVRALSPSLNDPGTAIKAIDYLTDLFILRMQLTDERVICDDQGNGRILFMQETFKQLLTLSLSPIRLYSKESSIVLLRLLYLFRSLLLKAKEHPHLLPVIFKEVKWLVEDAEEGVTNKADRERINEQLKELNDLNVMQKNLPLLSTGL
ncbi:DUF2254 domain-containing protein [Pontibacter cellulosilyticus]|uniref:DUF2254 domain-containing protein n=1 Tax=Pontibacter cellulosilyticus TaxID=1720253 RepID=A0A923SHB9_9BACT|nr:DUF2254 domain-containing protein [Pontibacter cellulosilyticus]MBC5991584.1 DUF2254 domain-containing protein [Pontibacter cellulosilyticus]